MGAHEIRRKTAFGKEKLYWEVRITIKLRKLEKATMTSSMEQRE